MDIECLPYPFSPPGVHEQSLRFWGMNWPIGSHLEAGLHCQVAPTPGTDPGRRAVVAFGPDSPGRDFCVLVHKMSLSTYLRSFSRIPQK